MKKIFILFTIATLSMMIATSCSSDEEKKTNQAEKALQEQTEMYNNVLSNIVGHWKGYQHYNTSMSNEGWEDISNISWKREYIFNADGTCKDIYDLTYIKEGVYTIIKNENYAKNPVANCELLLIITSKNELERRYAIWIEEGKYLRLADSKGERPSLSGYGDVSIRYKKK